MHANELLLIFIGIYKYYSKQYMPSPFLTFNNLNLKCVFFSPCSLGYISSSFRLHLISMEENATRLWTTHTHRSRIHQLRIILQNVELSVALSMNVYISPFTSILHFPYYNFVHFSMVICWVFVIHIFAVQFIERQGNHMRCPCMQT